MKNRPHLIPVVISCVLLLLPLSGDRLPHGYYTWLRIVVCGTAVFSAIVASKSNCLWAIGLFIAIAILFNPLIPVYLKKHTWQTIDLLTAIVFVVGLFLVKYKKGKNV